MTLTPHTDLLHALQDCFEGSWDRDVALESVGLSNDQSAINTWNHWQREMDENGSYNFVEKQKTKYRVAVREHYEANRKPGADLLTGYVQAIKAGLDFDTSKDRD
jgi:hypothetical protein